MSDAEEPSWFAEDELQALEEKGVVFERTLTGHVQYLGCADLGEGIAATCLASLARCESTVEPLGCTREPRFWMLQFVAVWSLSSHHSFFRNAHTQHSMNAGAFKRPSLAFVAAHHFGLRRDIFKIARNCLRGS